MRPLGPADPAKIAHYRLFAELGAGGMGRVFLGCAPDGRLIALKRIRPQFADNSEFRVRFRAEVAASRKVSGAYTAAVIDADVDAPEPWLASVFVPGPPLADVVETAGTLPEDAIVRLGAGLASALVEVHRVGLVHRDLKPSNVLLTDDGARVIDFGIVRAVDSQATAGPTGTGFLVGTPSFMSPEQVRGHPVTPASDVFSLGSVLVMACTGDSPFSGETVVQMLYQVVHAAPDLSALPTRVRQIVAPCLAKEPADRPTPAELLATIGDLSPTARPWPAEIHQLIDRQRDEAVGLTGAVRTGNTLRLRPTLIDPPAPGVSPDEQPPRERLKSPCGDPPQQPIQPRGLSGPPPVHPVVFQETPRQRKWQLFILPCIPVMAIAMMIAMLTWQSTIPWARPDTGELVTFSVDAVMAIVMVIVAIVMCWRSKLVLTQQGVYFTRWKTAFVRWSEVEVVEVYRKGGSQRNPRFVRFVLGDGSKIRSWVPFDLRDDQFDQKVWAIQQWHTQFGSPQPWWPRGGPEAGRKPPVATQ